MSLPDHVIEAAKLAYEEGKITEDHIADLTSQARLRRFSRFSSSKFKRLSKADKDALAEHAAIFSICPSDPELYALAQEQVDIRNTAPDYRGCFALIGTPVDTTIIIQHYQFCIEVRKGARNRTRNLLLSTVGLDRAAQIMKPYRPKNMAWTVTSGAYAAGRSETGQRTPSKAEVWLLEQMCLVEPALQRNVGEAQRIIREIINRTNLG